jgi:serine/threonine-protein kinase RsbW
VSTLLFQCRIGNSVEELPRILDGLESTGLQHDWDPVFQMQLALVIEELVVNAVNYGGQPPGQGWAEVRIAAANDGVSVTIEDNGRAFDPFSVAEPDTELDLDSRAIGGLGVHFVREMTQSYGYERDGALNRVTLFKRFSGL